MVRETTWGGNWGLLTALNGGRLAKTGLDGFTMAFPTLLECGLGKNATALRQLLIETGLNGGFMALVPKKGRARGNNNYISISCVGSVYKLVVKYLAIKDEEGN